MIVKELFDKAENGTLTYEQFQSACGDSKFVDLSEGHYVSKQKYDNELSQKDTRINELTQTLATRDSDLENLRQTLKDAGDLEALKKASKDLTDLQVKYEAETKQYQEKLSDQMYEFAVKEFANSKSFTSKAAKRDFTQAMIAKHLNIEDGMIIGAEDFVQMYSKDNADAFVVKSDPKPKFAGGTQPKKGDKPLSLSEKMRMKNENPDITFD